MGAKEQHGEQQDGLPLADGQQVVRAPIRVGRPQSTAVDPRFQAGVEAGLRFAYVLDGHGGCESLSWAGVRAWSPREGVLWVHLERDTPEAQSWVRSASGIDTMNVEALLAEESRPRVEVTGDCMLLTLRGVNLHVAEGGETAEGEDAFDLVPLHMWIGSDRVITLRDRSDQLAALRDIRAQLQSGCGPKAPAELLTRILAMLVRDIEPILDRLEDEIDSLDERINAGDIDNCRSALSPLRRRAIVVRRYIAPQREALYRMYEEEVSWLSKGDRLRLREVADRLLRAVEGLDALRDRATVLHEDISAVISERIANNSNRLTALTAVLLPPSLLAGLFGMNLAGIPENGHPYAFAFVVALTVVLVAFEVWLLKRNKWF